MKAAKLSAEERRRLRRRALECVSMFPEDQAKASLLLTYIRDVLDDVQARIAQDEKADRP
jgi:hypothetical protein